MGNTTTKPDTSRAKEFLRAVKKALKHAKEIHNASSEWTTDEKKGYAKKPPMLRTTSNWEVDDDTFEAFELLVDFMSNALFGVDCDSDSAVLIAMVNRKKHENFLPTCRVPRMDWNDPDLLKRFRQLSLAQIVMHSWRERYETMERGFMADVETHLKEQKRLRLAKGCELCAGNGWTDTDYVTWNALDWQTKCQTALIGCDPHTKEERSRGTYRIFCGCQQEASVDVG